MSRLVIDARLSGHSGIGVYIDELLPRILPQLGRWSPLVLAQPAAIDRLTESVGTMAKVCAWNVRPLSVPDLFAVPPLATVQDLLWTPHFNIPLRSRMPLAVTLHDLLPLTMPGLGGRARAAPVRLWLRAIRRRARIVFCVSDFTRREAIRHAAGEVSRFTTTHLGVNREWFAPSGERFAPSEMAAAFQTPPGINAAPTIVFVGLLKPHKNVARMLRAFAGIQHRIPHRVVLVAKHRGIRNVDADALAMIAELGDRVRLVENIALPTLIDTVASADFAMLCSLHEGFGLPALEAMAAGTPVLASRAGSLPEVCGDAAVYCDPMSVDDIARGMLELADDPALRERLAIAGRVRAATFSWDACAATTVAGLANVLRSLPGNG